MVVNSKKWRRGLKFTDFVTILQTASFESVCPIRYFPYRLRQKWPIVSASDPLDGSITDHGLELGQQNLFLLINMTVLVCAIHNLLVFCRGYLEIVDDVLDEFFEFCGRFAYFFHFLFSWLVFVVKD